MGRVKNPSEPQVKDVKVKQSKEEEEKRMEEPVEEEADDDEVDEEMEMKGKGTSSGFAEDSIFDFLWMLSSEDIASILLKTLHVWYKRRLIVDDVLKTMNLLTWNLAEDRIGNGIPRTEVIVEAVAEEKKSASNFLHGNEKPKAEYFCFNF